MLANDASSRPACLEMAHRASQLTGQLRERAPRLHRSRMLRTQRCCVRLQELLHSACLIRLKNSVTVAGGARCAQRKSTEGNQETNSR